MALPRLIACDLDGTLLQNGAQSLRPDTCTLISALIKRGVVFFAASGRQYTNLRRLFAPIRNDIGYLCENGCLSFWRGAMLYKEEMPDLLGREIIGAILKLPQAEITVAGEECTYIQPRDGRFLTLLRDDVHYDVRVVEDIFHTPEAYMKISLFEADGVADKASWHSAFGDRCTVVTSGREWLDFMPRGVNKGTGLKKVLDHLGIAPRDVMAIGDNDNDVEMLRLAGTPVAVRSARPAARAAASMETDTVEHLFERLLAGECGA